MGLFRDIYHMFSEPKTPELYSCLPSCVTRKLEEGRLAHLSVDDMIIIAPDEWCHYVDNAYRYNGSISSYEYDCPQGKLFITSRRVIFKSYRVGFDYSYTSLTSVELFDDGLVLQFGETTIAMGVASPKQAYEVLQLMKSSL